MIHSFDGLTSLLKRVRPFAAAWTFALTFVVLCSVGFNVADEQTEKIVIPSDRFQQTKQGTTPSETHEELGQDHRMNFAAFRERINGLWFKRKAFLKKNLTEAAAEQVEAMEDLSKEYGVTRLDAIASALVREGDSFLNEGNFEKAIRTFNDAQRFSADLPEAHFGLAAASWRSGSMSATIGQLIAGVKSLLRSRTLSSAALGNVLIIFILAIALSAVLISIAMLLRYQGPVRHDLAEVLAARYPGRFSRDAQQLMGWSLIALPLLTWVAALWSPAYWLALTFKYQKSREKAISVVLLALLLLSAPAARAAEFLFALAADPSARLMLASTSVSYDPEQILVLEEKAEANPQDPAYRFMLGALYARGRYFDDALAEYRRVIELDPRSYRAYNNMGNVFLRTGQSEEAVKNYKIALSLRKDFLPAFYNIYLARKELLELRQGEEALKEAQAINPEALARMIDGAKTRGAGEPVDAVISREEVSKRILGEGGEGEGIAASLISTPSLIVGIFCLVALVVSRALGKRHAERCAKCGDAFCHRCKAGEQGREYCSQCQQIFLKREGLSPMFRREKVSESERFRTRQARLSRAASLLFPGMSRLLDGRTISGALASAVWCASVLALYLRPRLLYLAGAGNAPPFVIVTVLLGCLAAGSWVMGNFRAIRDARAPAGLWQWH